MIFSSPLSACQLIRSGTQELCKYCVGWISGMLAESRGIYRFNGRLIINKAVLITLEMLQLC